MKIIRKSWWLGLLALLGHRDDGERTRCGTEVVLADLSGRIALRLEGGGDADGLRRQLQVGPTKWYTFS